MHKSYSSCCVGSCKSPHVSQSCFCNSSTMALCSSLLSCTSRAEWLHQTFIGSLNLFIWGHMVSAKVFGYMTDKYIWNRCFIIKKLYWIGNIRCRYETKVQFYFKVCIIFQKLSFYDYSINFQCFLSLWPSLFVLLLSSSQICLKGTNYHEWF